MKISSAWSTELKPEAAASAAYKMLLENLPGPPQLMLLHSSCAYDNRAVVTQLRTLAPDTLLQGGTSCLGVLTETGFHTENEKGLGLLGIYDPEGSYGVGISDTGDDPAGAAIFALDRALEQSGRSGEVPLVILITNHPGHEDLVIQAIEEHIGVNVPIIGGTSADNDMSGQWQQFGNETVASQAVSVAVLFPSGDIDIGYAFHSGYEPTEHRGIVTRAEDRVIYEIDHRPATEVYNEWTNGLITDILPQGGSMVPAASLTPVGNPVGEIGGVPYYRLSYPVEARPDQSILLFTDVREGNEIVLMKGTHDSIATRAGRVATAALDNAPFGVEDARGALVLFCTGCMLVVKDRMHETAASLKTALPDVPFLCSFTLGEQGCFIQGENRHGNLMVVVLVFGPTKLE